MATSITFKFHAGGRVEIDVIGATDASCEDLTRAFEEALGTRVKVNFKPDYWQVRNDGQVKVRQ